MNPTIQRDSFRTFLNQEFEERRRKEPNYSLRRFAKDLGEDPSALSRLLNGKTAIGPRTVDKLGRLLLLSLDEIEEFKAEIKKRRVRARHGNTKHTAPASATVAQDYQRIQTDTFRMISDWYHFAILELMQLKGFRFDVTWIAKKLGVASTEIRFAIDRLERLGFIELTENGFKDLTGGWTTNIAQPYFEPGHRRLQKQILEKAIQALETQPVAKRDQSAMTMTFPIHRMTEAKERIKEFRRSFNQEFGTLADSDSVYNLSISFYPLAEIRKDK